MVKPNFTTGFLKADEEGALRTFIDSTDVGDQKMGASVRG